DRFSHFRDADTLYARTVGTGSADTTTAHEWMVNQHRDTLALFVADRSILMHNTIASGTTCMARQRYEYLESMLQPCGPTPK
ncbi:hypothetical protein GQ42DRAFT_114369, partial [Ramicandelaber brevisporus]